MQVCPTLCAPPGLGGELACRPADPLEPSWPLPGDASPQGWRPVSDWSTIVTMYAPVRRSAAPLPVPGNPYQRFHLRRNPFGELTRSERGELAEVDVEPWLAELCDPRAVLQFLGPCGHGKTTHLLAVQRRLRGAVYVYLPPEPPRPALPEERPLLLDEAQRLGWCERRQLLRGTGPLVLGSHVDLARPLCRAGFRVRTVEVSTAMSTMRLAALLNRRIEASRSGDSQDIPRVDAGLASTLLQRFGADVRRIEQHLYHQFQDAVEHGSSWPPAS